jgi:MFS family permease
MSQRPLTAARLAWWELVTPSAQWLGISFMWSALHPVVLPALLANLVPASQKNTYLGLLAFAGLVIAMAVQPAAGALSDGWRAALGRRRPLMLLATALACGFLAVLGRSGALLWLCVGYLGLQVSSNTIQGPLQGLLRDRVPRAQLGEASSFKVLIDLISVIAAGLVAGQLLGPGQHGAGLVVLIMALLLISSGAVTILLTPENPSKARANEGERTNLVETEYGVGWSSGYQWLIAERALFLLGIYGLQAFGEYYLGDVLQVSDPARGAGDLMAAVGATTMVLVLASGWLADRIGAKPVLYVGSIVAALGLLLVGTAHSMVAVIGFGCIVGAGIGLFMTSNWTLANRLAPRAQAGRFLGLTNLATAGAAALSRLQGPAIDWLNSIQAGKWMGYRGLFVFGALCILASMAVLTKIQARSSSTKGSAHGAGGRNL